MVVHRGCRLGGWNGCRRFRNHRQARIPRLHLPAQATRWFCRGVEDEKVGSRLCFAAGLGRNRRRFHGMGERTHDGLQAGRFGRCHGLQSTVGGSTDPTDRIGRPHQRPSLLHRRDVRIDRVARVGAKGYRECDTGLAALEAYHKAPDSANPPRDEPLHDWASHAADAFRVLAEADMAGLIPRQGLIDHSEWRKPRVIVGTRF